MYKDDPRVWNAIMNNIASEFQVLERDGVELERNGRVYPIILGNKGDWSYLVTCQMFQFDLYPMDLGLGFSEVSSRVCVCVRAPVTICPGIVRKPGEVLPKSAKGCWGGAGSRRRWYLPFVHVRARKH